MNSFEVIHLKKYPPLYSVIILSNVWTNANFPRFMPTSYRSVTTTGNSLFWKASKSNIKKF